MAKKDNLILKVVAFGGFIVGGVAIAQAVNARLKRQKDEAEIAEIVTEVENFSGARGRSGGCWIENADGTYTEMNPCPDKDRASGFGGRSIWGRSPRRAKRVNYVRKPKTGGGSRIGKGADGTCWHCLSNSPSSSQSTGCAGDYVYAQVQCPSAD